MAYNANPTVVTGQTFTAANYNTYVKDNLAAVWVYTTTGDMAYASGSTTLSRLAKGTEGQVIAAGATIPEYVWSPAGLNLILGVGGSTVISTGAQFSPIIIPFDFVIETWQILAHPDDSDGSIVVDLWADTYANYPATAADTITSAAKPTITTAKKATGSASTWTSEIAEASHLVVNVDSVSTFTQVTLAIIGYKKVV